MTDFPSPKTLRAALTAFGWNQVEAAETLTVWHRKESQVVVPQEERFRDYSATVSSTLRVVRESDPVEWSEFHTSLTYPTSDQTRLRTQPDSGAHELPLNQARLAINGLWSALEAAARATARRRPILAGVGERYVQATMDAAKLIPPQPGSFVFAVVSETVDLSEDMNPLSGPRVQRTVNETLLRAVAGALEGSRASQESKSLDVFMEAVGQGFSVELARSLIRVLQAVGPVELSHRTAVLDPQQRKGRRSLSLPAEMAGDLQRFVTSQIATKPRAATVVGTLHQLVEGEGPFTIELRVQGGLDKAKVKLRGESNADRSVVSRAFLEKRPIRASGQVATEGQTTWLYGSSMSLIEPDPELFNHDHLAVPKSDG